MYRSLVSLARFTWIQPSRALPTWGFSTWLLWVGASSMVGCFPSPGPCDEGAALEVVYSPEGTPAFAGQAVMQLSCGNGGFCHGESGEGGIPLADRFGAPAGLSYDLGIAATSQGTCSDRACDSAPLSCEDFPDSCRAVCCAEAPSEAAGRRLARDQRLVLSMPGTILSQIDSGLMPPPGSTGDAYRRQVAGQSYDRFADDGVTATPLPTLVDDEQSARRQAQEIFRNWLACGAPVIERTVAHRELDNFAGFTVASCERACVDVSWPAIYEQVIEPSCTASRCHDADDPGGRLDLSAQATAYTELFERMSEGAQCGGSTRLVAGDPDGSLLIDKIEATSSADVCGSRMPLSGAPLSEQRRCAIREWVRLGACADPTDSRCAADLAAARSTCGVDTSQDNGCAVVTPCSNRL